MIKVKAIQEFTLKDFDKIKNIVRASNKNEKGRLYKDDTFECDKDMTEYLTGKNALNKTVVEIIEVIPEIIEVPKVENVDEAIERIQESAKETVELNEFGNPIGTRELKEEKPKKTTKKKTSKK